MIQFINETRYTPMIVEEYIRAWWNKKMRVPVRTIVILSLILLVIAAFLTKNLVLCILLLLLPVVTVLLAKFKSMQAVKIEMDRFQLLHRNSDFLCRTDIGEDIHAVTPDRDVHFQFSDIVDLLDTKNTLLILFKGEVTLALNRQSFSKGNAEECKEFLLGKLGRL